MNPQSPTSSTGGYPSKRARQSPSDVKSPGDLTAGEPISATSPSLAREPLLDVNAGGRAGQSSTFRNVSACNRCRLRKNKCDQRLPSCASCEKSSVKCVGYDPITKREIPRSYVFYLETRVAYLEHVLERNSIPFVPAEILDHASRPRPDPNAAQSPIDEAPVHNGHDAIASAQQGTQSQKEEAWSKENDSADKLNNLVSSISVQGASDPRYLGSTSGISFARVVFAAVKHSVSTSNSEKGAVKPSKPPLAAKAAGAGGPSMRDSFFGLHTKPTIKQARFPDRELGLRLVNYYFEHANPQIPILHRPTFMKMFEQAYAEKDRVRSPRELYTLNIVFAIGGGIFLGEPASDERDEPGKPKPATTKRGRGSSRQCQPEEYHASAIVHLESCLSSAPVPDRPDGFGGGLEELQAVLLLAGFALLRPVAPGLWYIIGVAVRLAVDLGLHYEDGKDIEIGLGESSYDDLNQMSRENNGERTSRESGMKERGRREWIRDFRRRLWWCTYAFDRLVSTCVGRPFGITDQVVTTEFPSLLEDKYITPGGFLEPAGGPDEPTYKHVAYHYFRLRLLQSEILQVLQYQQAQQVRAGGANQRDSYMQTQPPSPYLSRFDSFRSWRIDIDRRLLEWKESAPTKRETGVQFSTEFLELNYWQAIIMLYRQSLSTPPLFEGEYNTSEEVESPSAHTVELREDEDRVFLKVAEAGQRVLRLYRQLHRVHLVNYTFLATHHLFMAGISFLYAIWHSPVVRSRLTMDDVDFTILAATSVLGDLIEKCPPAEACRDAFNRMSKATVQMCMSTTGFSSGGQGLNSRSHRSYRTAEDMSSDSFGTSSSGQFAISNSRTHIPSSHPHRTPSGSEQPASNRKKRQFDMGLNDLFQSPSGMSHSQLPNLQTQPAYATPRNNGSATSHSVKSEYSTTDQFGIRQSQMHSPADYTISPSQATVSNPLSARDASALNASLLPSAHPPGSMPSYLDPAPHDPNAAAADSMLFSDAGATAAGGNSYGDLDFQLQGMDFLQGTTGLDEMGMAAMEGQAGLDLGFGLGLGWEGMDLNHDFSEGNQLDLFEGFFFGGTGGY